MTRPPGPAPPEPVWKDEVPRHPWALVALAVPVAALACALIAPGSGTALGAFLGVLFGAAGVAATTAATRWARGPADAAISAGLDLWRIPLLALLGGAVGWGGEFARGLLSARGRLAARIAGGVIVAATAVTLLAMGGARKARPVRDLPSQIASGDFRGFRVDDDPEPITDWKGVALDIPIFFYPGGYVSSFMPAGPGPVPAERRVRAVETAPAPPDKVVAWYFERTARYGFTEVEPADATRILTIPDPEGRTGMTRAEITPKPPAGGDDSKTVRESTIVLFVRPPPVAAGTAKQPGRASR